MYAVIKTGGKQYRVSKDDVLSVERLNAKPGDAISFDHVLMLGSADTAPVIGTPVVAGAKVTAEVLELNRGPKLIAFKKRRRKNSRRKKGHRQDLIKVRIMEVLGAGQTASAKPTGVGVKAMTTVGLMSVSTGTGRAFTTLKSAEGSRADDLSLIGGVGPKMEKELNKAEHTDLKWMLIVNDERQCDTNDTFKAKKLPVSKWKEYAKENSSTM